MPSRQIWLEILDFGRWAPSPHNIQSWRFQLQEDQSVTLFYDPTRLLPDTDPTGRFCMVGFGILLEMLSIAAAPHGYRVHIDYATRRLDAHRRGLVPLGRLTLVPRDTPETLDRQLILDRRTSRLPYDDVPVARTVLNELSAVAAGYGHQLEFSSDDEEVRWVVRLNADTMFFDMADPLSRNEVGGWIRFSREEARRRADGLAAYAMHFPGLLMKLFVDHNWMFRIPGIYQLVRKIYEHGMRGTRTVAWLSGPFETHEDWESTGRMFARLWLTMTKHGVYLHPFGSVITNPKSHKLMADHFANPDRKHDLWLLLRLGHSDLPPQAQRLTLQQLLVD